MRLEAGLDLRLLLGLALLLWLPAPPGPPACCLSCLALAGPPPVGKGC